MDNTICYCHGYTRNDLIRDVIEHGHSTIMDQIIAASKTDACNCEKKNPKKR